ncbi:MAG: cell division protein ZapD [Neisseriaceae bacterium]|nr:cell division protein ZapD [Neisseriaceae bacterium]
MRYELPMAEQIRILLRIETLFQRFSFFLQQENAQQHHIALQVLFEIIDVLNHSEIKKELLQALEKQSQNLIKLKDHPSVDSNKLKLTLDKIHALTNTLLKSNGKLSHAMRDNEWLMHIRQRMTSLGGVYSFDLPSYALWLSQNHQSRHADLENWITPLMPVVHATFLLLGLLRQRRHTLTLEANQGTYQCLDIVNLKNVQLIAIDYEGDLAIYPEITANKYAINVRFLEAHKGVRRPVQTTLSIPFTMHFHQNHA